MTPTPLVRQFHEQHQAARGRIDEAGKRVEQERKATIRRVQLDALLSKLPLASTRKAPPPLPAGAIKFIYTRVAEHFHTTFFEMTCARRPQCLTKPRQIAAFLSVLLTPSSLPEIGKVAKRDHSTILYSHRQTQKRMRSDPRLAEVVAELERECRKALALA